MGLLKFFRNFQNFLLDTIKASGIFNKNEVARSCISGCIHKKPVVILSSLYGIFVGPKEEHNNLRCDNSENEMVHNITLASIALKNENYVKAKNILQETLKDAQKTNHENGVTCIYDMLVSIAITLKDYEKAEEFLIKIIDRLLSFGVAADDFLVVSFSLKLSRVYTNKGDKELAQIGYKNCLLNQRKNIKKSNNEENQILLMNILYWYGKSLMLSENILEAKECLLECYEINSKIQALDTFQAMVVLYHLSSVCHTLGENDEALKHILTAITLDRRKNNPDSPYYYAKLGLLYIQKNLYKEAKFWCERGRKSALRYRNQDAEKESNECLDKLNKLI